jgi:hypothetical protein
LQYLPFAESSQFFFSSFPSFSFYPWHPKSVVTILPILQILSKSAASGSQTHISPKLFSIFQIPFFGRKPGRTEPLQGFFCGPNIPFLTFILYPRCEGAFSNP